ncbi:hypothetical protein ACQP2Y_21135 [Actinoplanes sp. CA-051413]|uniref:hypothetical protein n=1 Tax=Actinoplanes sp. CA-051413 TaxID=3239899 RepID=UPI003D974A6C
MKTYDDYFPSCAPCGNDYYDDEPAEPDPTPAQLAAEGQAAVLRIHALAAESLTTEES